MSTDTLTTPATHAEPAGAIVDSPSDELYFVMWLATDNGLWRPFIRNDGTQAVCRTLERAEAMLVEAKRHVAERSKGCKLAASSLRIAKSTCEEL